MVDWLHIQFDAQPVHSVGAEAKFPSFDALANLKGRILGHNKPEGGYIPIGAAACIRMMMPILCTHMKTILWFSKLL